MKTLIKCGHTSTGFHKGKPCCIICLGLTSDAEITIEPALLEGRLAECNECGREVNVAMDLPFFRHIAKNKNDQYYCGCRGWD